MDPTLMPLPVGIAPAPDLVRRYTSLELADRLHLERLMASWSLLADLSFSDLLLFVPITRDGGEGEDQGADAEARKISPPEVEVPALDQVGALVVLGQIR